MQVTTDKWERGESRVDWITYSVPQEAPASAVERARLAVIDRAVRRGGAVQAHRQTGYIGCKVNGTFVGQRDGAWLFQLSGDDAAESWERLIPLPGKPTRLDCAVTASTKEPDPHQVRRRYEDWLSAPKPPRGTRKARLTLNNEGGATFALGGTKSDLQLRFYDHGHRHKYAEPGQSFRWEAQLRRDYAEPAWLELVQSTQRELACAAIVRTMFTDRAVSCPWETEAIRIDIRRRGTTDIEGKLRWLHRNVRPTVEKLSGLVELVEILKALGLQDIISPDDLR